MALPSLRSGNALAVPVGADPLQYVSADDFNDVLKHIEGWVNVKNHGAVGDGVVDSTAAIEAAITAAKRASIRSTDWGMGAGGRVFLPRGVYRITSNVVISSATGLFIEGEGAGTTTILVDVNSASVDGLTFSGGQKNGVRNLTIEVTGNCRDALVIDGSTYHLLEWISIWGGGTWNGTQASGGCRYGLHWRGGMQSTARRVRVEQAATGIKIGDSSSATEPTTLVFEQPHVTRCSTSGIVIDRCYGLVFQQPIVETIGTSATPTTSFGVSIGGGGVGPAEVTLVAPYFENNPGWDIMTGQDSTYASNVTIIGPSSRASARKQSGYGFLKVGARTAGGGLYGGGLLSYSAPMATVDFASGATNFGFQIHGTMIPAAIPPTLNGGSVETYNGVLGYYDGNGDYKLHGDYRIQANTIGISGAGAKPSSGTWTRGDVALYNTPDLSSNWGWVCIASGTPGTWAPLAVGDQMGADQGDADRTLTAGVSYPVQRFGTTLTANRTITLSGGVNGSKFRVVRTGLGAFTLDVGGLKTIPSGTAATVEVMHDGTAWRLVGYQLL